MLIKRFKDTENILKKIKAMDSNGNQSSQISINIKKCLDAYNATKDYWEFVEGLEDMFSTIHYIMLIINSVWNDIQILLTFKKYFTDKMYTFMILLENSARNGANHAVTSEGLNILRTFLTRSSLLRNPRTIDMLNRNANIKVTELNDKEKAVSEKIHGLDSKSDRENFLKKLNRIHAAKSQIADSQGFINLVSKIYNIKNLTLDKS